MGKRSEKILNIIDNINIFFYRIFFVENIKEFSRNRKYAYQKRTRGFSDQEWYNFGQECINWCLPRLKHLRKHSHGCPGSYVFDINNTNKKNENEKTCFEVYEEDLDKIIWAMEFIRDSDDYSKHSVEYQLSQEYKDKWKEATKYLEKFGKLLPELWD